MLHAADVISDKGLDFLKLHHLHVVRNTALETEYRENPFPLLDLEKYADIVVDFLERLNPDICIERLFGAAPEEQLIGPVWGKSNAEIRHLIEQRLVARNTYQGASYQSPVTL
jgi:radical SAM superfamily enzyme